MTHTGTARWGTDELGIFTRNDSNRALFRRGNRLRTSKRLEARDVLDLRCWNHSDGYLVVPMRAIICLWLAAAVFGIIALALRSAHARDGVTAKRMVLTHKEFANDGSGSMYWTFWTDTETGTHIICADQTKCFILQPGSDIPPPTVR